MNGNDAMQKSRFVFDDLAPLIEHLAISHRVFQIEQDEDGQVSWQGSKSADQPLIYGHEYLPLISPKKMLFAEKEAMYLFDGETFETIQPQLSPQVLFGVQACDLTAIAYQDQFFKDDPYYQARRSKTILVGIDCEAVCKTGFCPQVNAGPHVVSCTADIILSRISLDSETNEPNWLLSVESQKGLDLLQGLALKPADKTYIKARTQQLDRIKESYVDYDYITNTIGYINDNAIPLEVWQDISSKSDSSDGCTNLCPTCSCYSTFETVEPAENTVTESYTTLRTWDSCLSEGFQKEASGHNPGHLAAKRVEHFWYHKFSDDFLPEFERYGCVGCGRCEVACPDVIGVHSVMKRIDQVCCN